MKPTDTQAAQAFDALREEAAAWMLRLEMADCRDDGGFEQWLATSPEHRRAWEEAQLTWQLLGQALPHYDRLTTTRQPELTITEIVPRAVRRRAGWARPGATLAIGGALLATLCLAAFIAAPGLMIEWQADYRTSVAETRAVTLQDGSVVQLAAHSAIKTDFEEGRRKITLLAGEAFFDVMHDAERPFVVDAGDLKVEVLGTSFDVRLGEDVSEVALARGAVRASPLRKDADGSQVLSPGDRLTMDRQSGDMSVEKLAPEDIGAWRSGRLFIINSSIGAAVEELQRYHPSWIMVPDRALANTRVTGIYDLSDPDKALTAIVSPFGGKVRSVAGLGRLVTRF